MLVATFLFVLIVIFSIGIGSAFLAKKSTQDYLTTGHSTPAWLVALSAVATNNSGYMFIGMIGYTFVAGYSAFWLIAGWLLGDLTASFTTYQRVARRAKKTKATTYPQLIADWDSKQPHLRRLLGILTIIFLGIYAAAQLKAGSKALEVLFSWPQWTGVIIGAIVIICYCFAGGIRASIWTDAAQSAVMIFSMGVLLFRILDYIGGFEEAIAQIEQVGPPFSTLLPGGLQFGAFGFILSWMFAGLATMGQPHVMIRFMSWDDSTQINKIRLYYYGFYSLFAIATIFVGLSSRLLLPVAEFDPELALPIIATKLLSDPMLGIILAGIFAATMSTADSLVLSSSASITHDLRKEKASYWQTKLTTVLVAILATGIALYANESVFSLVIFAWSVLGVAFTPIVILHGFGKSPDQSTSIIMIISGLIVMFIWQFLGLSGAVNEVMPGILTSFLTYPIVIYCRRIFSSASSSVSSDEAIEETLDEDSKSKNKIYSL